MQGANERRGLSILFLYVCIFYFLHILCRAVVLVMFFFSLVFVEFY